MLAFDFVAAYAESPIPFFVVGDTTATPRLSEAPQQVTLRFDPGVRLDPASLAGSISFVRSVDGVLGDVNDVSVMPVAPVGSVTVGDVPNENSLVIRFAETLPDDLYRFTITSDLKSTVGDAANAFQFDVRLDLGAFVTAVVPQPVERLITGGLVQQRDQVHVYFNAGDPLTASTAEATTRYRLVPVTAAGVDGVPISPTAVSYTASTGKAVLTFAPGVIADGMVYRLEVGPALVSAPPATFSFAGTASDDNSSFATATPLGTLGINGITATARIDDRPTVQTPAGTLTLPSQPGTIDEPGHRDTPTDSGAHGLADLTASPLRPSWVLNRGTDGPIGYYNFRPDYGRDPQGNSLLNTITEAQKQRTREVFEAFSRVTGIRFVEEVRAPYVGLTVVTGDLRAVSPTTPPGPGGVIGISGTSQIGTGLFSRAMPTVVMDSSENWGASEYGGAWFETAMHEIGHALGLPHSYDLPSIMGYGLTGEGVFPGDYDTIHLKQLFPTTGTDIDVYAFDVTESGRLSAETVAGRPGSAVRSFLDTALALYRDETVGGTTTRTLVARNDDYYGRDSFVGLDLQPGKYFLAVTSTGNDQFNPEVSDSGYGGRTRGPYELRLGFTPVPSAANTIVDTRGTPLDGDRDGLPGGTHAFWFKTAAAADTVFVDKLAPAAGADGTAAKPFQTITAALTAVNAANAATPGSKKIVRIVGNAAQTPYLIGTSPTNQVLADGSTFNVPKGVTVMIDAGAVIKVRSAIIDVGSSQPLPSSSRAEAALQVLGVPGSAVTFTSYHDDSIGGPSDGSGVVGVGTAAAGGQWGGIVFRQDSDAASKRAFVNAIQQADIRYGGGQVRVDSQVQSFVPIQIESTRPTIAFNTITDSSGAAIAATPNSFEESNGRIGPEIRGNRLTAIRNDGLNNTPVFHQNSTNGLFIKISTRFGSPLEQLDVPARFKSTDIVYVLQENLVISGGAGGYTLDVAAGRFASRSTGRLAIDPGVVVKLQNSRIELERGAGQLIAEGGEFNPVIFTSLGDNRYGAGGTFDTNGNVPDVRAAGDWGGITLNAGTRASIDRAYLGFGGGLTPIEGTSDSFNVIEVHQGDLRLTNTRIENNLSGLAVSDRTGRGTNAAATVFIRGGQPIIVGNDFRDNAGAVVSINANSLSDVQRPDIGRSTGSIQRFDGYDDNVGPLVAANVISVAGSSATIAGMKVRGEEITVEGVWDDTDIVHVVEEEIVVRNFHTATGLRLQSKPDASLIVKLRGTAAGFTAEGYGLDIDDRIGGTVQIIGQPGRPVILTSLADDTVGAGVDPLGVTVTDTGDDGVSAPTPGDWRSLKFLPLSNDRNVSVYVEAERPLTSGLEANAIVDTAEDLGVLAPNFPTGTNSWESAQEKSGDENRRLGFEVHGFIAPDDPTDVDVYSFQGYAGSEIWIDVDKTASGLDAMVELLDSDGNVLARSIDERVESRLVSTAVPDAVGGFAVTYALGNTSLVQGTLVGSLIDGVTSLPIQDFSIAADGSVTFYDRLPASTYHATGATLDPVNGLLILTFDNPAGPTRIDVSYVHATGSLSAATLGIGQSAQRDGWRGGDYYTTNPQDPGMRLVLPGPTGQYLRYYVRVRSQPRKDAATLALFAGANQLESYEASLQSTTFDQPGDPAAGVTSGRYELRVRLRQRDEKPGSVVRYADIRFPTVGIDVLGLPRNSLLTGETGETTAVNDTWAAAQYVGNLLESDRNTISVAGELGSATDVDWYQFALNYEQIQGTGAPPAWATVFDIDYADGFRGDLTLAVFDSAGTLIYVGRDSDVRDDQPGVGQGNDFDDLSRGTLGKLDPFIGTVQLPAANPQGTRASPANPASQLKYYVAVMSNGQLPSQLNATFQTAAGYTLVRLEPVTSIKRVVEDHIGFTGYTSQGGQVDQTTINPNTGLPRPLIDVSTATALSTHIRPFTLADVTLFVSSSTGLFTVDAVTGLQETTLRTGITGITLGDLDMRTDGKLYAYAGVNNDTTTVGRLIEVDAGDGDFLSQDDDDIENVSTTTPLNYQTSSNTVTALAFRRTAMADYDELWFVVPAGTDSKLYRAADGGSAAAAANAQADQSQADSTTLGYRGRIQGAVVTGLQFSNDSGAIIFGVTDDGRFVSITPGTKVVGDTPDFNAGLTQLNTFTADLTAVGATGFRGLAAAPRNLDGGRLAGMFVAVTDNGRLCVINPATNQLVRLTEWGPGTAAVPGELFSPAIGVTGVTGLAFSPLDINLWHPTERRGDTARDTVGTSDAGHGINAAPDDTRIPGDASRSVTVGPTATPIDSRQHTEAVGGVSMYFGLEDYQSSGTPAYLRTTVGGGQHGASSTWQEDLTANSAILNNYNLPGGAYGSLITNSFSLAGYASTDKPTLYFNYWLETENAAGKTNEMRDSARVLISTDQGLTWQLLATNNSSRSSAGSIDAELPTVISASSSISQYANQHVQELFDSAAWRQARVDLGKWVGNTDIRLRFDFHTAGEFDPTQRQTATTTVPTAVVNASNIVVASVAGIVAGMDVTATGVPAGTKVSSVDAVTSSVTLTGVVNLPASSVISFSRLANSISGLANTTGNVTSPERGQDNDYEGFYVDDIIIGFAERGEMVTGAQTSAQNAAATTVFAVATPPGAAAQSLQGPYQLEIRRGTEYAVSTAADMAFYRTFDTNERLIPSGYLSTGHLRGDSNLPREQGQFVIDGNVITSASTYGISIDAGARDTLSNTPHPGVARNLPTLNDPRLAPGAFVVNNVVSSSGTAGIRFSGDATAGTVPQAVVPYGRLVNNTIYGGTTAQGLGIVVSDNAGPTLMNNLFANLATGISVDASSQKDAAGNERTVVTHSGFSGVTTPVTGVTDRFRVTLPSSPFVNAAGGNFYPAAGTPAIDTSLNSLQDRNEFLVVNSPIGVPAAPILAPEKDLYGQVRWDDPSQTPSVPGLGLNAFKDLGAIDRVDFSQSPPYLVLLDPEDNGPADADLGLDAVEFQGSAARNRGSFSLQIIDAGAGIDEATVVVSAFTLTRDGMLLVAGKDYVFRYLATGNRVVFEAASTFKLGVYEIVALNTIKDRAGNSLRPNDPATGSTKFTITLADVPYAPAWPTPLSPLAPVAPALAGWHDDKTVYLGWNPAFTVSSRPVFDYDVEMSTDNFLTSAGVSVVTPAANTVAASLVVPNLTNGTSYWFRVRAKNSLGAGPWSDVLGPVAPQPKPTIVLAVDTGSSATDGITRNGQVNVSGVIAGATWQYRFAGGSWINGSGTSFTLPDGTYSAGDAQVRQIVGGFPGVPATNGIPWTIDSVSPLTPVITNVADDVTPMTASIPSSGTTNDTSPTFTGTAEAGTTLRIAVNGGTPTTLVVPADGTWTYMPILTDGTYVFSFVSVDVAENESLAVTFALTVDTITPATPAITSVSDDVSPVTGSIPNGGATNDTTPSFSGTAEAGTTLRIAINDGTPTTLTVPVGGEWTYMPTLADGTYVFSFVSVDAAGNESAATFNLTVDTVAPATPVITSVIDDASLVTGSLGTGSYTNDPLPTFNGTAEAGTILRISLNGASWADITVPSDGIWAYTFTVLPDGPYDFSFIAVDAAGNQSVTATFGLTIDTVPPVMPLITSVTDNVSPVTGSLLTGGTTNDTTPTFTGTAEPGTTLRIAVNGGAPTTMTVPASGIWTYSPALTIGAYSFSFVSVDAAGNESPAAAFSLTVDTVAPVTPVITSVTDDVSPITGTILTGGITNDTTPTFTGTAEVGTTLRIAVNGGTPATMTVPAGGIWTHSPTLVNGTYAFSFVSVDAAGNESPAAAFSLTVDAVAPVTPVITGVTDNVSPATGSIVAGGTTNDTSPTFNGTAEAGTTLRIAVNGGIPITQAVSAGGTWTYMPTLVNGTHAFSFVSIDAAGNESPAAVFSLTVDTVAPVTPVITSVTDDVSPVTGAVLSGEITNDTTPTFTGTAEARTTLRIAVNGATPTTMTVPADGVWTYTPTLVNGTYAFSFVSVDAAGNESPAAMFTLTVDTIAPTMPVITSVTDNASPVTGSIDAGGTTNDTTPTFTGTAEAGTTLRIAVNGGTPTTMSVLAGGTWTYTPTLGNGTHAFSFVSVDAAGNESTAATFTLTVDTVAPQVTAIQATSPSGTYGIGQFVDIQISFSEPVSVTGVPELQLNTTPLRSAAYVSGNGTNVFTFRYSIQIGDQVSRLDYASSAAFAGGSFPDAAGNPANLTLPSPGAFLGATIAIDALIKATVSGLGQWPGDPPDFASQVSSFQVQFNTPVTGLTLGSISLQRLADQTDPASGRPVSLTGVSISGSGTNWTITLPSVTNPTSLKGRYKLVIGGVSSSIQAGGATMSTASEWYFDRI